MKVGFICFISLFIQHRAKTIISREHIFFKDTKMINLPVPKTKTNFLLKILSKKAKIEFRKGQHRLQ